MVKTWKSSDRRLLYKTLFKNALLRSRPNLIILLVRIRLINPRAISNLDILEIRFRSYRDYNIAIGVLAESSMNVIIFLDYLAEVVAAINETQTPAL